MIRTGIAGLPGSVGRDRTAAALIGRIWALIEH
jgi:hypothetical protein